MKKILLAAAGMAALSFTACKKDDSVENNPGSGNPAKLLKKITKTENGETTLYNFTYDASKRLTSYKSTDNLEQVLFTYDGGGNIIKVEETEEDFRNIYTYTYNNGVPVSGTFKSWQKHAGEPDELIEDDILTYTLENDQVTNIHLNMTQYGEEVDFKLSYANGNLTRVESSGLYPFTASFAYGNKKGARRWVAKEQLKPKKKDDDR